MNKGHILVVDDVPANLTLLSTLLVRQDYAVTTAQSGPEALAEVQRMQPDLILLDINMPDMDGYKVCTQLKAEGSTRHIPVIFLSSSAETLDKVRAFQVGGVDYISRPFQIEEVVARVETHIGFHRQRQELEALRQHEKKQFEALSRMKDQFVRTVSHDLKNPISMILSSVALLREMNCTLDDAEAQQIFEILERKANYMLSIVTDLLDLAKAEAGMPLNLSAVPLQDVLDNALLGFEFLAQRKQIELVYPVVPAELRVNVDRPQFAQVINNLLSNAIKYTPNGGRVETRVQIEPNAAIIRVMDTGLGIPPEDLPHIFDKFYRVNRIEHMAEEGTGLGLSIARAIIEQHGGQIQVESTLGVGSTFSITLPLVSNLAADGALAQPTGESVSP